VRDCSLAELLVKIQGGPNKVHDKTLLDQSNEEMIFELTTKKYNFASNMYTMIAHYHTKFLTFFLSLFQDPNNKSSSAELLQEIGEMTACDLEYFMIDMD
jgi:hypothetical protein